METTPLDDSEKHLYEALADRIRTMIREGTLEEGQRIPSIRRLSRQFSVSKATVQEAYRLLEDQGLVEARSRSGYFVRPAHLRRPAAGFSLPEPAKQTTPLTATLVERGDLYMRVLALAETENTIPFGAAIAPAEFLPVERLGRLLGQVGRYSPERIIEYRMSPGLESLRVQIARRAVDAGLTLGPDDIVITTGATEALMLSLRAICRRGDVVAVASPTYYGFMELLESLELKALEVDTDPREGMSVTALERCLRDGVSVRAVLVVPNVSNPLGSIMPDERKQALAALCAVNDIPIIEDDVHGELSFKSRRPLSIKAFDGGDDVVWCGSFSKSVAPGFRIGWVAPGRYRERIAKLQSTTTLGGVAPTQMVLARFLEEGGFDRHLKQLRRTCEDHVRLVSDLVGKWFPDGTRATRPQGGHVLWVEMPDAVDAVRLAEDALKHRISLAPGTMFSASGRYRNCVRINCAVSWSDEVEAALELLGELAARRL